MANEVKKLNLIAIGDIKNVNTLTDANLKKLNLLEWSSGPSHVWTEVGAMGTAMSGAGQGFGAVNTAVVVAGGYESAFVDNTQERNGTTWGTGGDLSATRQQMGSCGTSSAGLCFGGWPGAGGNTDITQLFDGTSVSTGSTMVDPWGKGSGGAKSSNQDAIYLGGQLAVSYTNRIGTYTSDTWATNSAVVGGRGDTWGSGSTSSSEGIIYGGDYGGNATTSTQQFNGTTVSTGGSLNTGRTQMSGRGTLASQWCGEGNDGDGDLNTFEQYNGSTWTSKGSQGNFSRRGAGGAGQDADDGLLAGGWDGSLLDGAETWDGSTCTVITSLNQAINGSTGGGSQTSALIMGGDNSGQQSTMQEWDNTSWTTLSATLNTAVNVMNGGAVPVV